MENKLLVYTTIFGPYDKLVEPKEKFIKCDFKCITDQKGLTSKNWDIVYVDTEKENTTNVLLNRKFKMLPHIYFPEYEYSLYVDANISINKNPIELISKYLTESSFSYPRHSFRECIYDEADFCFDIGKISYFEYSKVVERLIDSGFPEKYGLAENNILLRKSTDVHLNKVMFSWWKLMEAGDTRDQLSLIFLLWKNNIKLNFMTESSRNKNHFFDYNLHLSYEKYSWLKRKILLMSARRNKSVINSTVGRLLDFINSLKSENK